MCNELYISIHFQLDVNPPLLTPATSDTYQYPCWLSQWRGERNISFQMFALKTEAHWWLGEICTTLPLSWFFISIYQMKKDKIDKDVCIQPSKRGNNYLINVYTQNYTRGLGEELRNSSYSVLCCCPDTLYGIVCFFHVACKLLA